jgi:hypothetical protein
MTFADIVDEVRLLPTEGQVELRHVIDVELEAQIRNDLYEGHLEALDELRQGKLKFTTDADELIRWLETE